ncbi:hypothetical protein [Kitasatospora sp. NPDC085464]|uniref:hypothetical protein n=1 Tax=Kitasatospora sp. NPDC085464 TaxID=3364063 RepID=UPI0037CA19A4
MTQSTEKKTQTRLEPLSQVARDLWVLSGNECAYDGCTQRLMDESGAWVGEIAHIIGVGSTGARNDPSLTDDELRHFSNLVILCGTHHTMIDHVGSRDQYTVEYLRAMKERHEAKVRYVVERFEEQFLDVTKASTVRPCSTLNQFWLGDDPEERAWHVEEVNRIAGLIGELTPAARQVLAFLIERDAPIDLWELGRHNGEAEPVRTSRLMAELDNRGFAYVDEDAFEGDLPHQVVLRTGGPGGVTGRSVLNGWSDFWDMLRNHLATRTDASARDVIVDLNFSLLD